MPNLWGGSREDDLARGSVINQLQAGKKETKQNKTRQADSNTHALNTHKINAPPYHSVNKEEEKCWQGSEREKAEAVWGWRGGSTQTPGDKKQSPYENNNAVSRKQGKTWNTPPPTPTPSPLPHLSPQSGQGILQRDEICQIFIVETLWGQRARAWVLTGVE